MHKYLYGLLFLLVAHSAGAATYWIDDTGTDQASCTSASACGASACLTYAYLDGQVTLTSGDVINWCPGTYSQGCVCLDDGVTYQGSTGTRTDVTLQATDGFDCTGCDASPYEHSMFLADTTGNNATIRDMVIDGSTNASVFRSGIVIANGKHDITIDNVRVTGHSSAGGIWGETICTGGTPCTDLSSGIYNITLTNSAFDANGWHGLMMFNCYHDCPITNTNFYNNTTHANADGLHVANAPGIHVTGGAFYHNSEEGIDFSRTGNNGGECNDYFGGICAGGASQYSRCFDDSECPSSTCTPWIVEGTLSYDPQVTGGVAAAAFKNCTHKGIIRNNMWQGKTAGALTAVEFDSCAHDIQVYNNTLHGIVTFWANQYGMDMRNNVIQCNAAADRCVKIASSSGGLNTKGSSLRPSSHGLAANTWDYNLVYNSAGSNAASNNYVGGGADLPSTAPGAPVCEFNPYDAGITATTWANTALTTWQTDTVFAAAGVSANDVWNSNSVLVNASASPPDLHLQSASPARDVAAAAVAPADDYDGDTRPVGTADDIGADEWSSSPAAAGVTITGVSL